MGQAGNNFRMPGHSSTNSGSTRCISYSGVESAPSSLKNFQSCISSGMDTVSSVALDLVETQSKYSLKLFVFASDFFEITCGCSTLRMPFEHNWNKRFNSTGHIFSSYSVTSHSHVV